MAKQLKNNITKNKDEMFCSCGGDNFKLSMDGDTVECAACGNNYKVGSHLYSGCAETCGMLYPYRLSTDDDKYYWCGDQGSQDWRNGKSNTFERGQNFS